MNAYELSKKYYPRLWNIDRLEKLVEAGKLSAGERDEIVNDAKTSE